LVSKNMKPILRSELLDIINSDENSRIESAETQIAELWSEEFHYQPPMVEIDMGDGESAHVLAYNWRVFERLDCSQVLGALADLIEQSKEAREAFFAEDTEDFARVFWGSR
jgi:hypothetical protein